MLFQQKTVNRLSRLIRYWMIFTSLITSILFLGFIGSIAISTAAMVRGSSFYENGNYEKSLEPFNIANKWWLLDNISPGLARTELLEKMGKAKVMIRSADHYQNGVSAYKSGNFNEAKKYFQQMAINDPNYAEAQKKIEEIKQASSTPIPTQSPTMPSAKIDNTNDYNNSNETREPDQESLINNLAGVKLSQDYVDKCYLCGEPIGSDFTLIFHTEDKTIKYPKDVNISIDFYLYGSEDGTMNTKGNLLLEKHFSNSDITENMRNSTEPFTEYLYSDLGVDKNEQGVLGVAEAVVNTPQGKFTAVKNYCTLYEN